jgi:hypothetical protein
MLKDGITVYWDGDFGMGTAIFMDEALTQPAPDADHVLEDGTIVTTKDGVVTEIAVSAIEEDAEDLAVDPAATESKPISMSEVSAMIDARFSDLMDEISKMKELIGQKDKQMTEYKKEVEEKFSTTPALGSVKSDKKEVKLDDRFNKDYQRIMDFAKI